MGDHSVIRIKPNYYIHVVDNNANITRVECGPQTFTRQEHEKVISGPDAMIIVPPRHYCIIANPVVRSEKGEVVYDANGQLRMRHGDEEIRFEQDPFPLYPNEKLVGKVSPLQVVAPDTALRLKCLRDFKDKDTARSAGDEWLFRGPGTYVPRIEVQVVQITKSVQIKPNQALKLRAIKEFTDPKGAPRKTGEEWLVREIGAYLPQVEEEVVETVQAFILTDRKAIHLRAARTFTDQFGKHRKAGEEWLVKNSETECYIPDINEVVVGEAKITTLTNNQYCVVLDPWKNGKALLGQKELRKGPASFFLLPGERLEAGIQPILVLDDDEAILLASKEAFSDGNIKRNPGDRWLLKGPTDYVPPVVVDVIERRKTIPLDDNEGIYVRDMKSGRVRSVVGHSYLLEAHEELWKKELPKVVEEVLAKEQPTGWVRDKTRVVTYKTPHNRAVQIYNYREKKARVVFGPDLCVLGPDEQFTVLSLSAEQPKRPNMIKAISLFLGPDFMTDVVIVETADHARLSLKLSYNWHFEVDKTKLVEATKLFQVPDFVGDCCKAVASRVRGAVASSSFDAFHKNSAKLIQEAVFGRDDKGQTRNRFVFSANNLVITNIDVQSVEPVDQRTRDSLQKSVQLAIEITTKSQEANAKHENHRLEQESVGRLDRQKLEDEALAEKARKDLILLKTQTAVISETGQAKAEARARSEAQKIEGEASVTQAQLEVKANKIRSEASLKNTKALQDSEVSYQRRVNELEIAKAKELATIESSKFANIVDAIGTDTIKSMAEAGPAQQAKLLQSLGLKSFLITDGNSPINLFNTAQGLIGDLEDKK